MNLQEKQLREKNKLARRCGVALCVTSMAFAGISLLAMINTFLIIRIVTSVVLIIVMEVMFKKIGNLEKYRFVVTISMAVLYLMNVFHSPSDQIYTLMYSIIIIVLIYGYESTVKAGCVVAIAGLVSSDIFDVINGHISGNDLFTQAVFASVACYMAIRYCKLDRKHVRENQEAIQEGADAQTRTAGIIVELAEQLSEKFVEAQDVSDALNESMEATHASVNDIVEGTKATAEAIEHQTSQTADIQENINSVGQEATNIGEISERVDASVKEGVLIIEDLKRQAEEVAKINVEASETTKALNESIQDVQAITETILGISSQTNLLALNASIEAARAGEAGKGFAVVADEIRALSESTREATEEIAAIIERLTKDATSASAAMGKSADYANKQQELIGETGAKLADIREQTEILYSGVNDVKSSVGTVVSANTEIMDSISNLSATSEEVAASADTVLGVSDNAMDALQGMNAALAEINEIAHKMEETAKA